MEEVDNIFLVTLRQIGVAISPNVKLVKDLSVDEIVEAVARGLRIIDPSREYSTRLPKEMSSRYRICSTLAAACQQYGFRGELGFHQFLYPNETETRKLLTWLVEALPKAEKKDEKEVLGSSALLQRHIISQTTESAQQPWLPAAMLPNGLYKSGTGNDGAAWHYRSSRAFRTLRTVSVVIPRGTSDLSASLPKELRKYWEAQLPLLSSQAANKRDIPPTVFEEHQRELAAAQEWETEWNSAGLASGLSKEEYRNRKRQKLALRMGESVKAALQRATLDDSDALEQLMRTKADMSYTSRFSQQTQLATNDAKTNAETEEELTKRREAELQALRDRLSEITVTAADLQKGTAEFESNLKQLQGRLQEESGKTAKLEEEYKLAKEVYDLLDNPDKNIADMKEKIDAFAQRLEKLASEWEVRRLQLVQQYRELKDKMAGRMAESQLKLEKIKEFRRTMKGLADEAREKNDYHQQLVEEYERLPKDVQRSQYTERIMEIVRNVKKQNLEIERVLVDTRVLQKEIAALISQLGRTYSATDELVYKDEPRPRAQDAKKDEFGKRSYKLLVSIHDVCGKLTTVVEETGALKNTTRDFEDKIDQLTAEKTAQNLEKIINDVETVRKENIELVATIKKAQLGVA